MNILKEKKMDILILIIFNLLGLVYLKEITNDMSYKECNPQPLLKIDYEGNINIEIDSIKKLKLLNSPTIITSSIGISRSGKSTILNLILNSLKCFKINDIYDEYNPKNNYGIWWINNNNTNNLLNYNLNHIIFDTESLIIGKNINSSIKLIMLILIISDNILINIINEIDIGFIDFIRSLIIQTILFSSLFIKKLNELNIIYNKTLKKNLIFLIENLHKKNISWLIHSNNKLNNENNLKEFSNKYKNKLKSRIEMYIWPENNTSNLYKNLNSFIDKFNFYIIPYINEDTNTINDISLNLSHAIKNIFNINDNNIHVDNGINNMQNKLKGSEIIEIIELFSEHFYLFNSLGSIDLNILKNDINKNSLIENTLFIFGTKLEDQLINENIYPLLEIEADVIYNNILKDIILYWSSISEFNYFDTKNLFKDIKIYFENLYKSILKKNCDLIKSHCSSIINIHISHTINKIKELKKNIPISEHLFLELTNNSYNKLLEDIEISLKKSNGNFESKINSYSNSPCCNIDKNILYKKIQQIILDIKKKNQMEIEKIILNDFIEIRQVMKKIDNIDESYYKINKYEFEKKLKDVINTSKLKFNSHINLINETLIKNKYISEYQLEIDEFIKYHKNQWDNICRKYSYNFAKSLAIKENISIRNKLILPLIDNIIIINEFERLKNNVINEMNNIYCYNESSWKYSVNELILIIEDDKNQLIRENLISLKNFLHRPLQYALKNTIEISKKYFNWNNFIKEATIIVINSLKEFDNLSLIKIDNKTKDKIIELWIEQDLIILKKNIIKNQIFLILRYTIYLLLLLIIISLILFKNNIKIILILLLLIITIIIYLILEIGNKEDKIKESIMDIFKILGFSKLTIYYIRYNLINILIISTITISIMIIIIYMFIKLYNNLNKNNLNIKNINNKNINKLKNKEELDNEINIIRKFIY